MSKYIERIVSDERGMDYKLVALLYKDEDGSVFETNIKGKVVNIASVEEAQKEEWFKHKRWLLRQRISEGINLLLPEALLTHPYIGYVIENKKNYITLTNFINKPDEFLFEQWYNEETGGVKKRLEIAMDLARVFRNIHALGFVFANISPLDILVHQKTNSLLIRGAERLTKPGLFNRNVSQSSPYIPPELLKESREINSFSNIYTYALIIFEVFYSQHPFDNEEVIQMPSKALFNNRISDLFKQTFIEGKEIFIDRPAMLDFFRACRAMLDMTNQCKNCHSNYIILSNLICPWCQEKDTDYILLNCIEEDIIKDPIFVTKKVNKVKTCKAQILLEDEVVKQIRLHHFSLNVAPEYNILIGYIVQKDNEIYFLNHTEGNDISFVINRQSRERVNVLVEEQVEIKADDILFIQHINGQDAGIEDILEDVTMINYMELSKEVNI